MSIECIKIHGFISVLIAMHPCGDLMVCDGPEEPQTVATASDLIRCVIIAKVGDQAALPVCFPGSTKNLALPDP